MIFTCLQPHIHPGPVNTKSIVAALMSGSFQFVLKGRLAYSPGLAQQLLPWVMEKMTTLTETSAKPFSKQSVILSLSKDQLPGSHRYSHGT
jgi:hypothetical protein